MDAMNDTPLSISSVRLDKLQTEILTTLYERSETWHHLPNLARAVFPGAAAYRDSELLGFLLPRLRRMRSHEFVKLRRLGATISATISLKGIEFVEQQVAMA
jgi:hypothetical protein